MEKGKIINLEDCDGKDIITGVENIIVVLKQALFIALAVLKLTV